MSNYFKSYFTLNLDNKNLNTALCLSSQLTVEVSGVGSKEGSNCELVNTIVNICKRHVYVSRCNGTEFNTKLLCNYLIRDHFNAENILLKETNRSDRVLYKKWGSLLDYLYK